MRKSKTNSKINISYKNQLKLFVKHTPAAVAMFDTEMRYILASDRWYTDYGIAGQKIIGKTHYEVFPEIEGMDEWKAIHQRCLNGETMKREEDEFPRNDGHSDWIRWEIYPWYTTEEKVGGIIMFTEVITARKEAELKLKREREKARLYLDMAGTLLLVLNKQGIVELINEKGCEILGYERKDIVGKNWFEHFLPQELTEEIKDIFHNIIYNNFVLPDHSESYVVNKKGEKLLMDWSYTLLRDDKGDILGTISSGKDITDKKATEELLLEKAQILDQVFEAVITTDLDGTIETCNKASEKLYGYSDEELIGKNVSILYPEDQLEFLINNIILPLKVKGTHETEVVLKKKNGETFPGYLSLSLRKDTEGNIVGMIGSVIDITERKKAEKALNKLNKELEKRVKQRTKQYKKTNKELKSNEQKFRQIAENTQQALWLRKNDEVIYINPAFESMFDLKFEELQNNPRVLFTRILPEDLDKVSVEIEKVFKKGTPGEAQFRIKKPGGETRWIHIRSFPFKIEGDEEFRSVGIGDDITELVKLNAELIEAKNKAETANKIKSEFLANMSHEIRTPMNSIIGFADLLFSTVQNEKQKSHLKIIRHSGRSLLTLINDILDLSKVEAGKMEIRPEPINIYSLIKEIEQIFIPKITEKQLEFIIDIDKEIPHNLLLDELRLRQVIFNIVGNAVKFTGSGFIKLTIKADAINDKPGKFMLQISVEDTGIGIPKEDHENIFDTFKQQETQNTRAFGGTGLGLTITKRLVNMMGGEIGVESAPDEGSLFWVKLPNVGVASTPYSVKEEKPFDLSNINFGNAKILVADDVEENCRLIEELFYDTDVTIYQAVNGKEAVEMAEEFMPDVIILDCRMPVLNGLQATEILRHQTKTKHIPIIGVSASSSGPFFTSTEVHDKFDEFMIKPLQLDQLIKSLSKYLNQTIPEDNNSEYKDYIINLESKNGEGAVLLEKLQEEFYHKWESAYNSRMIEDIEKFAVSLKSFGEEESLEELVNYSEKLTELCYTYDIEEINKLMSIFPVVIHK